MKYNLLILFSLCLVILPIVSADIITPGFHGISINNYIENINSYPDYVFVSDGSLGTGMCPLQLVSNNGKISGDYYKFCSVFVYAIPKNKINETKINEMNGERDLGDEEIKAYFESLGGKEVIEGVQTYSQIPVISSIKEKNNYYNVSLNQVKTEPDRHKILRNALIYVYIIIPIIAILIIAFILIKRRRK